jgi:hypothetical protein
VPSNAPCIICTSRGLWSIPLTQFFMSSFCII